MEEYTLSETKDIVQAELTAGLDEVLHRGAQQMLSVMLEWEVAQYIDKYQRSSPKFS